jgi:DegV family protein with EDD domain
MSIAVVTDSTSDISPELAQEYRIGIVPSLLILDGKEYLDGEGITREEYYRLLPQHNPPPSTAAPSSGMFDALYRDIFNQGYEQIISIHAATTLTTIHNSAMIAAEEYPGRVTVVDSHQLSMGLGFMVLAAAEAANQGLDLPEILEKIEDIGQRVRVFAMLDTLEQLKKSGRVSWARANIGTLLQVKPFIELRAGEVLQLGNERTRRKGITRLKQYLQDQGPLARLAVLHTNAEEDASAFLEDVSPGLALETPVLIRNVTTVIGTHLGVNGLGFAALIK